jgi:hypothetical protein
MPWPQDQPQEWVMAGSDFSGAYESGLDEIILPLGVAVLILAIGVAWLGRDSAPSWRSKRITEAARKGAKRFAARGRA